MNTLREQLTAALRAAFSSAFPGAEPPAVEAVPSTKEAFGDFQCNAAMAAAKSLHMPPRDLAARWADAFSAANPDWTATVAGPGFLNLAAAPDALARHIEAMSADPHSGIPLDYNGLFTGYYSVVYKAYRAFYRVRNEYIEVLRIVLTKQDYMKILIDLAGQAASETPRTPLHEEQTSL